jgi:tetratricopeptide (TPR) repeat protein
MNQLKATILLRFALIATLSGLVAAIAGAQTIMATYVDGQVSQGSASSWKSVEIGDAIDPGSSVKLSDGAYIELKTGEATLSLGQAGVYSVHDLITKGRASRQAAAQAALSKYMQALSSKGTANASTVAGVRGAEQGESDSDWVTNDTDVYLSAAKDYIASGDYPAAKEQLAKALDNATTGIVEIEFYIAETAALSGNTREAAKRIEMLHPTGSESWAPDYELLKARMLVDECAPQAAVDLLAADQTNLAGDSERAPLYYFILALAYKDLGDSANSKDCADRLKVIAADSELAKAVDGI